MKDKFRTLNGYSWDYALVFKVFKKDEKLSPKQKEFTFKKILCALSEGGIETKVFYSAQVNQNTLVVNVILINLILSITRTFRLMKYM